MLIVLIGAAATLWATQWMDRVDRAQQRAGLAEQAEQIAGVILGRFAQYETLLHSGRALFAGSAYVSRAEWGQFSSAVLEHQTFAGLAGLAWIPRLGAAQIPVLSAQMQADGLGALQLDPPGDRAWYCPIIYNEPFERNRVSLGRDICTVDAISQAVERTRAQVQVELSEPLELVYSDGSREPAYVMLIWVDGTNRQHAGWIAASVMIEALMGVARDPLMGTSLQIFDVTTDDGGTPIYSTDVAQPSAAARPDDGELVQLERRIDTGGRQLRLVLQQSTSASLTPRIILTAGLLITVLLAGYLISLLRTRARAVLLADRMTHAYRDSEQLLSSITNNIFEGIYRGEPAAGLVYANDSLARMFGFATPDEMIQHAGPILYARAEQRDELLTLLEQDGFYRDVEVEFIRADGSHFIGVNNAVALRDDDGVVRYFDGAIYDITERKRAEEQVQRLAHYDVLTGLPNRALLDQRLRQNLTQARRSGESLAVLFMDLDHFKNINDSLGHGHGDRLLVEVARRLGSGLRGSDTVCRQGGDEFLIVLTDTDAAAAAIGAQRVLDLFVPAFQIEGHDLRITPSIGISIFPDDALDVETLIRNADAAMYLAKESGRAHYQFFTPELNARAHERLTLESELRSALGNGQFSLHYQPFVQLEDGAIVGAEALLRWNHPERGLIAPGTFIPVAEQSGLIVEIGDWVIEEACRQLAEWVGQGIDPIFVAVNVSAVQFWRGGIIEHVERVLNANGLRGDQLELELTESVIMHDAETASQIIRNLNTLGIRLAIDDFGTGYSSLGYLKRFAISKLKIDQSFVQDIPDDPDDTAIIAAVLSLAEDLNLGVVAEGVETLEQMNHLKERGCPQAQGFLFSPAVPADEFAALLARGAFVGVIEAGK